MKQPRSASRESGPGPMTTGTGGTPTPTGPEKMSARRPGRPPEFDALRRKYVGVLKRKVVDPLRRDLQKVQRRLESETRRLDPRSKDRRIVSRTLKVEMRAVRRVLSRLEATVKRVSHPKRSTKRAR